MLSLIILVICVLLSATTDAAPTCKGQCPKGWLPFQNGCYFFGTRFPDLSYYAAAAFCSSIKSRLTEPDTIAELQFLTNQIKLHTWKNGPWYGMLRPFNETANDQWVLAVPQTKSGDSDLNKLVDNLPIDDEKYCGGDTLNGDSFGWWKCTDLGSPICETSLCDLDIIANSNVIINE